MLSLEFRILHNLRSRYVTVRSNCDRVIDRLQVRLDSLLCLIRPKDACASASFSISKGRKQRARRAASQTQPTSRANTIPCNPKLDGPSNNKELPSYKRTNQTFSCSRCLAHVLLRSVRLLSVRDKNYTQLSACCTQLAHFLRYAGGKGDLFCSSSLKSFFLSAMSQLPQPKNIFAAMANYLYDA